MTENKRQYRITKAHAEKFSRALEEASANGGGNPLRRLGQDAIRSQLHDLEQELREYDSLRYGKK